jgi:hypothetical protein
VPRFADIIIVWRPLLARRQSFGGFFQRYGPGRPMSSKLIDRSIRILHYALDLAVNIGKKDILETPVEAEKREIVSRFTGMARTAWPVAG